MAVTMQDRRTSALVERGGGQPTGKQETDGQTDRQTAPHGCQAYIARQ